MMLSLKSKTKSSRRLGTNRRTVPRALCCSLLLIGCGKETQKPDPCDQENAQAEMDTVADADLVADILYDELVEIADDETKEKSTVLSANFVDRSGYEIVTAVTPLGDDCVGMVGRPTSTGDLIPLSVDSIVINSSVIGEFPLELDEFDTYFTGYTGNFFSDAGGEKIKITVTSSGEDGTFPSFSGSLSAPPALVNAAAAVTPDGALKVEWSDGGSTYIELVLRASEASNEDVENRVRCFYLKDDGCFVVPFSAMEWLTSNGANKIKVRMERHTLKISKPADNAIAEIDAMRSIEFNINI